MVSETRRIGCSFMKTWNSKDCFFCQGLNTIKLVLAKFKESRFAANQVDNLFDNSFSQLFDNSFSQLFDNSFSQNSLFLAKSKYLGELKDNRNCLIKAPFGWCSKSLVLFCNTPAIQTSCYLSICSSESHFKTYFLI